MTFSSLHVFTLYFFTLDGGKKGSVMNARKCLADFGGHVIQHSRQDHIHALPRTCEIATEDFGNFLSDEEIGDARSTHAH